MEISSEIEPELETIETYTIPNPFEVTENEFNITIVPPGLDYEIKFIQVGNFPRADNCLDVRPAHIPENAEYNREALHDISVWCNLQTYLREKRLSFSC